MADPSAAQVQAQAFAFRQLVKHMQMRTDVQNIDQMNLAGFCRNCLSKWIYAGFASQGPEFKVDYSECQKEVYGMDYGQWKSKYQKKATGEQMRLFKENSSLHAKHPKEVEEAAKSKKKKAGAPAASEMKGVQTKAVPLTEVVTASGQSDVCCKSPDEIASAAENGPRLPVYSALAPPDAPARISKDFKMRVAVLTVSDRAFAGVYKDESGPAVKDALAKYVDKSKYDIRVISTKIVPDGMKEISTAIRSWAHAEESDCPSLILTTGGTGFSSRDVTPEATKQVSDRLAPTLAAGITLASSRKEPFALLSRAQDGIGQGRPKAVTEILDIALPKLTQAVYHMLKEDGGQRTKPRHNV